MHAAARTHDACKSAHASIPPTRGRLFTKEALERETEHAAVVERMRANMRKEGVVRNMVRARPLRSLVRMRRWHASVYMCTHLQPCDAHACSNSSRSMLDPAANSQPDAARAPAAHVLTAAPHSKCGPAVRLL